GAGQMQRQAAPAAADVQNALAGRQQQLGSQMYLLVALRDVQIVSAVAEICAAILPVGVEEEVVQPPREVVMVRDVLFRQRGVVARIPAFDEKAQALDRVENPVL